MSQLLSGTLNYRWTRSPDGVFAGVCQGLGLALGIESWMLRVIWLVAILAFGAGVLVYLILAVCLPRADQLDQALGRKALGVCARISVRYRLEVGLVRTGFVFLAMSTFGLAVLVYGLLYFFVPKVVGTESRPMGAGE